MEASYPSTGRRGKTIRGRRGDAVTCITPLPSGFDPRRALL